MQLKTLVAAISPRQIIGPLDRVVEGIAYDSRRVQRNGLFVALRGEKSDGHQFVEQAVEKGATVIVTEHEVQSPRATCLVVDNTRSALADLAAIFFERPARRLKLAAVTGTNGKTTTTFLLKHICEKAGVRCGLLGTVRYEIADRVLPAVRTTPESLDIQDLLAQMVNAGCKAAAMEVSSHALSQDRVRGIEWDVAVFTNLTQDHLDFHGTMENYFEAKATLFTGLAEQKSKTNATAVINLDDRYGVQLANRLEKKVPVITYGLGVKADFRASNYHAEFGGTSYQLDARGKSYLVRVPLIGRFNVAAGPRAARGRSGEAAISNLRRLRAHRRCAPQRPQNAARTFATPAHRRLWLRRRSRQTEAPAHGARRGSKRRLQHHHFR
jgi:UDP-N-acetylmuramoyl-L-alanyl-D-glutamate--2,6-diaminopimelate ligase